METRLTVRDTNRRLPEAIGGSRMLKMETAFGTHPSSRSLPEATIGNAIWRQPQQPGATLNKDSLRGKLSASGVPI